MLRACVEIRERSRPCSHLLSGSIHHHAFVIRHARSCHLSRFGRRPDFCRIPARPGNRHNRRAQRHQGNGRLNQHLFHHSLYANAEMVSRPHRFGPECIDRLPVRQYRFRMDAAEWIAVSIHRQRRQQLVMAHRQGSQLQREQRHREVYDQPQ